MRKLFKKRQNVFIRMIRDQASLTLEGMEALKDYMTGNDPEAAGRLITKEKQGVDESLYFPNARFLEDLINDSVAANPAVRYVILECPAVNTIDFSGLESLEAINLRLKDSGIELHLSEVKHDTGLPGADQLHEPVLQQAGVRTAEEASREAEHRDPRLLARCELHMPASLCVGLLVDQLGLAPRPVGPFDDDGAGDVDGRVRAGDDADGEREGETPVHFTDEEDEDDQHDEDGARGDDGAAQGFVDALVDQLGESHRPEDLLVLPLDSPAAVPNYRARGFRPFKEERYVAEIPAGRSF